MFFRLPAIVTRQGDKAEMTGFPCVPYIRIIMEFCIPEEYSRSIDIIVPLAIISMVEASAALVDFPRH